MYTLGVFSDSHGQKSVLLKAMEEAVHSHKADGFLFLGDGLGEFTQARKAFNHIYCWQVQGNNDFLFRAEGKNQLFLIENQYVFAAHGHQYGVKNGLERLYYAAFERGAKVACFGHTHMPLIQNTNGLLLFNPGAVGAVLESTYGIIKFEENKTTPYIFSV